MITIDHVPEPGSDEDRRVHPRSAVERPVKLFDTRSGKYHAGSTCDISVGGVLIEMPHTLPCRPGDDVLLGIAQKRREPLLRRNDMIRAKVVRMMHTENGRLLLAAEFPPHMAMPLPQRRAA